MLSKEDKPGQKGEEKSHGCAYGKGQQPGKKDLKYYAWIGFVAFTKPYAYHCAGFGVSSSGRKAEVGAYAEKCRGSGVGGTAAYGIKRCHIRTYFFDYL